MNVEKFQKDLKRFCTSHHNCTDCSLNELTYGCYSIDHLTEIIPVVQKWTEEHPLKTYLMDFKEKFPKADVENIVWGCCCRVIYEGESCSYSNCVECWNREME